MQTRSTDHYSTSGVVPTPRGSFFRSYILLTSVNHYPLLQPLLSVHKNGTFAEPFFNDESVDVRPAAKA